MIKYNMQLQLYLREGKSCNCLLFFKKIELYDKKTKNLK